MRQRGGGAGCSLKRITDPPNLGQATSARKRRPEDGNERRAVVLKVQTNFVDIVTGADPEIVGRPGGRLVTRFKDQYRLTHLFRKENRSSLQVKLNALRL